jgi:hypothetical protein
MDRFNALGRGLQIMLVAGVLLFIDTFFNWQSSGGYGVSAWDDFGGIVMALLTIVMVAWLGARIAGVEIPVPVSDTVLAVAFGVLIFLLALIKNLQDEYSSAWAWIGLILAAAILVGAWFQVQATGGMDALKTDIPRMPASSSTAPPAGSTTAAAPPPTPAAAPSDTAQPAPPPPPAAEPPMGEPAAPAETTPAEESPSASSGLEPSTEPTEERE